MRNAVFDARPMYGAVTIIVTRFYSVNLRYRLIMRLVEILANLMDFIFLYLYVYISRHGYGRQSVSLQVLQNVCV
jgi:hypothetical protein